MNKRKFGRTNLHVSELCLSTAKFNWINDETASLALLDAYHSGGGNFIQSMSFSPKLFATQPTDTQSEEIVGRWHRSRARPRDSFVLSTRINLFRPSHGGSIFFANRIRESCENSLRRLQVRHLDLLICEWDEHLAPIEDAIDAFDRLIHAGLVRYVVAGSLPPWRVVDSLYRSTLRNHCRFEALQTEYSLMTRARFEPEVFAMCREHRLGFIARSPLAGGFLAKRPVSMPGLTSPDRSWLSERFGNSYGDAVLNVLARIAEKRSASPAQIALAWVLRNPQVSSALVSPTSTHDLRDLMQAADIPLTEDDADTLTDATNIPDYRMELRHA